MLTRGYMFLEWMGGIYVVACVQVCCYIVVGSDVGREKCCANEGRFGVIMLFIIMIWGG